MFEHFNIAAGVVTAGLFHMVMYIVSTSRRFEKLERRSLELHVELFESRCAEEKLERSLARYGDLRTVQALMESSRNRAVIQICEERLSASPYRTAAVEPVPEPKVLIKVTKLESAMEAEHRSSSSGDDFCGTRW